jgi:hypothetical protein
MQACESAPPELLSLYAELITRLEAFLTIRGQEYLASIQQGTSAIPVQGEEGVSASELRKAFLPGAGQGSSAAEQGRIGQGQGVVLPHERPPPAVPVRR